MQYFNICIIHSENYRDTIFIKLLIIFCKFYFMKKIYPPVILFLLLLSYATFATGNYHSSNDNPPCTAEIITTDQEVCDNFFQVIATPPEAGETGMWVGPANTSFADPMSATTFITNLGAGNNTIIWRIFDSSGTQCSEAQITLINNEVQTTPIILTDNNEEVCDENGFQVVAEGPLLPGEVGSWSSDNPDVTFTPPNGLETTADNLGPGNNVIFWTISNNSCSANPASITVINNEVVTTAAIELFSATESCVTDGFDQIFANISDPDNQLVPGEVGTWTGPSGVTFSPNSEAPTIDGLLPGDNMLVWTISRGNCPTNSDVITITNNEPNNVNINVGDSDSAACADDALNLSADPPNADQTGMWSGPAGAVFSPNASMPNVSVTGTPPGVHQFFWTLTQGGCDLSDSIQVEIFDQPAFGNHMVNNTSTVGGSDGSIDFCLEGGTPPFDVVWEPFENTNVINQTNDNTCPGTSFNLGGLSAGVYMITITDANGCSDILGDDPDEENTEIMDPDCTPFNFGLVTNTNESCDESDDGTITIEVLNGQGAIIYSLGNVNGIADVITTENPFTFTNLPAGEYNLFISDERLCTDSFIGNPVTVTAPAPLEVTPTGVPTATLGGADGSIAVCINGGTGPYTVTWTPSGAGSVSPDPNQSNCDDNQLITGLTEGDYDVMVVDANGCEFSSEDITVNPPICEISLDVSDIAISNVSCNGENDASITIGGVTDTPPLEYSIDGGVTYLPSNVFDNLSPGNYLVFIRDGQACTAGPVNIEVTEPAPLAVDPTIISTSTVGGSDGQIQLCIEGGTPPNSLVWTPSDVGSAGPSTDPTCDGEALAITGLSAGVYMVTITDANGCMEILGDIDTIRVPDPECLSTTEVIFMDNSCGISPTNPSFDGTIEVTIVGDAPPPFIIDIGCDVDPVTTNEITTTFTGLPPCNYVIQVTSADNCMIGFSGNPVTIDAPEILSAPFTITETSTVSGSDGEICVEPMGGTPPYTVAICDQPATQGGACNGYFVGGLSVGDTCNVLVLDANLCESTGVLFISGPDCSSFSAELDGMNGVMGSCAESNTGAINLNVMGGLEPYTFNWSNGATTEDVSGLPGGTYTVTVSDSQECEVLIESIEVETFDPVDVELGVTVDGMFTTMGPFQIVDDSIQLGIDINFDIGSVMWSPPDGLSDPTSPNPSALPSETTTYTVEITTAEGCMATAEITIEADVSVVVPTGFTPNGDGNNDTFFPVIDGNVEILQFSVWNRWGEKIYDNPEPPGWDGFYKSVKQPLSTFVYILEFKLPGKDPEILKGDVVLIR